MQRITRRDFVGAGASLALSSSSGWAHSLPSGPKLAVTTDEIDDDLDVALTFLRRHGVRYCEIRKLWGKYNTSLPLARIREARSMLDDAGIQLAILDTSFFKVPLPDTSSSAGVNAVSRQWELLDRAFERAEILGTKLVRTFAFTHKRNEKPDPARYPQVYDLVRQSAERAQAAGFRLAVENVAGSYVATATQSAAMLHALPSPALGLTWDPNNSAGAGDPEPFPAGYERLDPGRIWHVHVRDYRRLNDGTVEWCGVGDGEFDHLGQMRALRRDGYEAVYSLETHFLLNGSKATASEHSLKGLLKVVQKL